MTFQAGNKEQQKADRRKARVITQQLISALNEAYGEGDGTKLRAVVDAWIKNAIGGDQQAINSLADRIDGKVAQAIVGDDEHDPVRVETIRRIIVKPGHSDSGGVPPASEPGSI